MSVYAVTVENKRSLYTEFNAKTDEEAKHMAEEFVLSLKCEENEEMDSIWDYEVLNEKMNIVRHFERH